LFEFGLIPISLGQVMDGYRAPDVGADSTLHGTRCGLGSDSVSALLDSIAPSRVRLICTVDIPRLHGVRLLITPPTISHRRYRRIHSVSFHGLTQLTTDNHIRSISCTRLALQVPSLLIIRFFSSANCTDLYCVLLHSANTIELTHLKAYFIIRHQLPYRA